MEDNAIPQDDPISYFKANFVEEENNFNTLYLDCPKPHKLSFFIVFSIVLGIYFLLSIFISNILLTPMSVEGSSMYPTLNAEYATTGNIYAQDVVYLWQTQNVEYKDIVVFDARNYNSSASSNEPIYYIKRVIATAGDTLQFVKTSENTTTGLASYSLIKNGVLLEEDYILDEMIYNIKSTKAHLVISEQVITIPENYVFVMGDNRNNSKDSRELGLISTDDILGKMVLHIEYGETVIEGIIKSIKLDYLF